MDWFKELHHHKYEKNIDSIMNPGAKVTWPQFIVEMIIYNRTQFLDTYKDIHRGPNWYKTIAKQVRSLNQQACVLANYFPHINEEPLVIVAFKNFFRKNTTLKIGQYRKVRFSNKKGRVISNITQDEKDVIVGVFEELDRLLKQRESFSNVVIKESKKIENIKFATQAKNRKNNLQNLLDLEQQLKNDSPKNDNTI